VFSPLLLSSPFRSFAADLYKRLQIESPAALTKLGEEREERGEEKWHVCLTVKLTDE
jgi:hypothetical protein